MGRAVTRPNRRRGIFSGERHGSQPTLRPSSTLARPRSGRMLTGVSWSTPWPRGARWTRWNAC